MKDNQNHQIAIGIVAAFVVPLLIGLLFQWSGFTILIIMGILLLAVVAFVLLWVQQPRRQPIDPFPREPRTESSDGDDAPRKVRKPPEPTLEAVNAHLPSNKAGYTFQFSATMSWLPEQGVEHSDRSAVADKSIFVRASRVTEKFALTDRDDVLNRLRAELGSSRRDEDGVVMASASDIDVTTDDDDADRLRRMANVRKHSEEFDYNCHYERGVRTYLTDEALKTPGSTLMLWLARHRYDFDEAERRLGTFARISAVAQDREPPAQQSSGTGTGARFVAAGASTTSRPDRGHTTATLIGELLPAATDDERGMFADELARLLGEYGATETAGRLRSKYGLQDLDDDTSGPPAVGGSGGDDDTYDDSGGNTDEDEGRDDPGTDPSRTD